MERLTLWLVDNYYVGAHTRLFRSLNTSRRWAHNTSRLLIDLSILNWVFVKSRKPGAELTIRMISPPILIPIPCDIRC
jgi:hypothetical protein